MQPQHQERREDFAYILDSMPTGKSFSNKSEPIVQLLGEEKFTLLEEVPKPGVSLSLGEKVYIGKEERDKISMIKSKIVYDELTQTAKNELPLLIDKIINDSEQKFIEMFNTAGPINIRQHMLELIPGIGKKHLTEILKQRSIKKFENFEDLEQRIGLKRVTELIRNRIILEMRGGERFTLFIRPPKKI